MPNGNSSRIYRPSVVLLLLTCVGGVGWMVSELADIRTGLGAQSARIEDVLRRTKMQTVTTTWTSGGQEYSVSTTRREAEDTRTFIARHDETVAAMQQIHPPDPR